MTRPLDYALRVNGRVADRGVGVAAGVDALWRALRDCFADRRDSTLRLEDNKGRLVATASLAFPYQHREVMYAVGVADAERAYKAGPWPDPSWGLEFAADEGDLLFRLDADGTRVALHRFRDGSWRKLRPKPKERG